MNKSLETLINAGYALPYDGGLPPNGYSVARYNGDLFFALNEWADQLRVFDPRINDAN